MTEPHEPAIELDEPEKLPMKMLGLITGAYNDAVIRLAYAERDRHGWNTYFRLGHRLVGVGARVLIHAYALREHPAGDPAEAIAEAVRRLRNVLTMAEETAENPNTVPSTALEIQSLGRSCAMTAGMLIGHAAQLSPSAIAATHPIRDVYFDDDEDDDEHWNSGSAGTCAPPNRRAAGLGCALVAAALGASVFLLGYTIGSERSTRRARGAA